MGESNHLSQKSENRTDEEIKDAIQRIAEEGLKHNIHFIYVSTYGQSGNNEAHCNFGKFIDSFSIDNFNEIILLVPDYNCLILVSDWLHLIKDLRGRFSNYNIQMFPGTQAFNLRELSPILYLDELVFQHVV